jgi:hypothetical protein
MQNENQESTNEQTADPGASVSQTETVTETTKTESTDSESPVNDEVSINEKESNAEAGSDIGNQYDTGVVGDPLNEQETQEQTEEFVKTAE